MTLAETIQLIERIDCETEPHAVAAIAWQAGRIYELEQRFGLRSIAVGTRAIPTQENEDDTR